MDIIEKIFDEIKYFKTNYINLSKGSKIYFKGLADDDTEIIYENNNEASQYYILNGKIKDSSIFSHWLVGKYTQLNLEDLIILKSCLKKNIQKIYFDDNKFVFYILKDGETIDITFINDNTIDTKFNKINKIEKCLTNSTSLDSSYFISSTLDLYLKDNKITTDITDDKLIEISVDNILSLQKDMKNINLKYSTRYGSDPVYVQISSESDDMVLKQTFLTI
jgi:hypothetical protein